MAEKTAIVDVKDESLTVNLLQQQLQDTSVSSTTIAEDAEKLAAAAEYYSVVPHCRSTRLATTLPGPPRLYCPMCKDTFAEIKDTLLI